MSAPSVVSLECVCGLHARYPHWCTHTTCRRHSSKDRSSQSLRRYSYTRARKPEVDPQAALAVRHRSRQVDVPCHLQSLTVESIESCLQFFCHYRHMQHRQVKRLHRLGCPGRGWQPGEQRRAIETYPAMPAVHTNGEPRQLLHCDGCGLPRHTIILPWLRYNITCPALLLDSLRSLLLEAGLGYCGRAARI
ncbi:hypothetical protein EJ03DRAFT_31793 [Teratosphaeria nubilosa]|uniref:Uncharacterized protein n=1 Tax=Teratosphaeria nubilosa TaxID=161662 RepID=A0A6G1LF57_9PEZI|nr:hypothetical protein EJ03DRAFT_31793 [Teratosphaeria nubilosa]